MPNVHHITVTMRGPRDIAIDVPGACQVRCLGPDAFSRAARLFCEVEGGEDWPETAGLVTSVHSEGPNGWNRRALWGANQMQPHPTTDRAHSPAPPLTPDVSHRDDRAADLDRRARVACATRLVFSLNLRREHAQLAANDVIDTYLEQTRRAQC